MAKYHIIFGGVDRRGLLEHRYFEMDKVLATWERIEHTNEFIVQIRDKESKQVVCFYTNVLCLEVVE